MKRVMGAAGTVANRRERLNQAGREAAVGGSRQPDARPKGATGLQVAGAAAGELRGGPDCPASGAPERCTAVCPPPGGGPGRTRDATRWPRAPHHVARPPSPRADLTGSAGSRAARGGRVRPPWVLACGTRCEAQSGNGAEAAGAGRSA